MNLSIQGRTSKFNQLTNLSCPSLQHGTSTIEQQRQKKTVLIALSSVKLLSIVTFLNCCSQLWILWSTTSHVQVASNDLLWLFYPSSSTKFPSKRTHQVSRVLTFFFFLDTNVATYYTFLHICFLEYDSNTLFIMITRHIYLGFSQVSIIEKRYFYIKLKSRIA